MTAPAASRTHAAAIVTTLSSASLTAYLSEAPRVGEDLPARPYVVVHPTPGSFDGTLGDRFRDLLLPFQTTAVGDSPEQALWAHDATVTALLGAAPAVSGRVSHPIWLEENPEPVRRDDTLVEPLFYATARWVFHTTA